MPVNQWIHLRPRGRQNDLRPGLEARIHDPLWLLHRQWQMGEFRGEDAGSPVSVKLETEAFPLDQVSLAGAARPYNPLETPLEALVERETVTRAPPDLRARAQEGLLFLRRLELAGVAFDRAALTARLAFPASEREALSEADATAELLLQRTPDAGAIRQAFPGGGGDAELAAVFPGLDAALLPVCRQATQRWLTDYDARVGRADAATAWREERLEYACGLAATTTLGRVELAAPEYPGGRLDWDAFHIQTLNAAITAPAAEKMVQTVLPAPVTFPGMPAPRLWQFEDAAVDFGDPETMEQDLGRLLLAEFIMAWGNDWFLLPVEAPLGSLCRLQELLVTDVFGVVTRVLPQHRHSPHWAMNRLTAPSVNSHLNDFLFIPPVLPASLQGPALESALLLRDEAANVAWAVETILPDPLGRPIEVAAVAPGRARGLDRLAPDANFRYRVMSDLPEQWLPLLPTRDAATGTFYLTRAGLLDELEELQAPAPRGRLLGSSGTFRIHQEELPRAGLEISRAWQLARWRDGCRVLWVGRRKRAGVGELRSDLEFDSLLPQESAV